MHVALGQQHHPQAGRRVQGQAGAGEPGVRDRRRRPETVQDVEVIAAAGPAQAAVTAEAFGLAGGRGPAQSRRDHRIGIADPPGGEPGQVRRRREQPGVAGDAAHQASVLVVHSAGPRGAVRAAFGGGEAFRRTVRPESRRGHAERAGHQAQDRLVERPGGHGRHHLAQGDEPRVGVGDPGSGRRDQRGPVEIAQQFLPCPAPSVELAAIRQAGGVREQVPEGDRPVPAGGELRQVTGDRIIEAEPALTGQRERDRGRRHHLGQRREVEDGVRTHRPSLNRVGLPRHPPAGRGRTPADHRDRAGNAALGDRRVEQRGLGSGVCWRDAHTGSSSHGRVIPATTLRTCARCR